MAPTGLLLLYSVLIIGASLAGGLVPLMVRLTHQRLELAVSFVAGVMLGVGVLDLLAHALEEVESDQGVLVCLLFGFLVMFFVERFFCFHHHEAEHDHATKEQESMVAGSHGGHRLTWSGAAVGLTVHSMIAGVALAASVESEWSESGGVMAAGFGMFLVIFLHKPFDSLTLGTLMAASGRSVGLRHLVNVLFALAIPAGGLLFQLGLTGASAGESEVVGYTLAFAAGTFLCIAMSDLLPELQFHQHDRWKLSAAMLLGLLLSWGLTRLEGI